MERPSRIKVLHTENAMGYTGGFKALYDFIRSEKKEIESIVVLPVGSSCRTYLEEEGITVYEIPFVEINRNIIALIKYIPCLFINAYRIHKIARKERVDVLHSNDLYNLSLYLVKYVFRYDKPLVVHLRLLASSYPSTLYLFWKKMHLRFSDALVAVSRAVAKGYGDSDKIHLVYDITHTVERHPKYESTYRKELSRPFAFFYLANFTQGKGQDLALEAFRMVVQKYPHLTLTFAGGTLNTVENLRYRKTLQEKVSMYSLDAKIFFEGFVEDVELKMKQYDCILNFSYAESFSFTSYDALRFGIPLIVSDCGGPAELFENGRSGLLIANKNKEQMARAMIRILEEEGLASVLSMNSKIYIQSLLSKSNNFSYLTKLFISLSKRYMTYGVN